MTTADLGDELVLIGRGGPQPAWGEQARLVLCNVWVESYFLQKVLGFVLASVLVGALTILGN